MDHPYSALPDKALWRKAVASSSRESSLELYQRKWPITREMKIATAGSCFAQHIGRNLRAGGFNVLDNEPAPANLPGSLHATFGYSIYSARYGNIYTARQMLQLVQEAFGECPESTHIWERGGRYYDALRPTIEPDGLSSAEAVRAHRRYHLDLVRSLYLNADLVILTLGLTESWVDRESGTVFPVCPGVAAGEFDPTRHVFHNFGFVEILKDLQELRELLHRRQPNKRTKILLTVSPVPLTATASGRHVMQATVYSKSVLRAVAGEASSKYEDVDYFPSYEIIANPWQEGIYYDPNLRTVSKNGVDRVMATFMRAHDTVTEDGSESTQKPPTCGHNGAIENASESHLAVPQSEVIPTGEEDMAVVCDEELMDAFGRK